MNHLLECMFRNRGYTPDFWTTINTFPHSYPKDTDAFCARLKHYHDTQELVVLLTDFDMDGISCGVEGFAGLSELGFNVSFYLLQPVEGYGFTVDTIDRLRSQYPAVKAIVTADVGISCSDAVAYAQQLGIEMLVTDHHKFKVPSPASIWVDPARKDEDRGYAGSSGSAVLYYILLYYVMHYTDDVFLQNQIQRLVVFAGCGVISDTMPVQYENRKLVQDAMEVFKLVYGDGSRRMVDSIPGCPIYRRAFQGLYYVMQVFRDEGKNTIFSTSPLRIHEDFVSFYMAPAFNSVKRMRKDIHMAYDVFFGATPEQQMVAVYHLNQKRKEVVAEKFPELIDGTRPQPWAPYIYITDANLGVCGLLAQKVMALTGEPVFVVNVLPDGSYSGSGRCPVWFPFLTVGQSDQWTAGGHNPAFGITIYNEVGVDALFRFVKQEIPKLKPKDWSNEVVPDFVMSMFGDGDAAIESELVQDYLEELEQMHPFGRGFEEPECLLKIDPQLVTFRLFGDGRHVRITLPQGLSCVCWNQSSLIEQTCVPETEILDNGIRGNLIWKPVYMPDVLEIYGRWCYDDYGERMARAQHYASRQDGSEVFIQFVGSISNIKEEES